MTTTLETLTTPLTVAEIKTAIYDTMAANGVDTTGWKPGAVVRTMVAGVAIILAAFSSLIALLARSGFLSLSEGEWLTLVARYVYDTERITATFATGTVTIDNASGNIYAIDPGDLILLNTATGATYRNTALVNIGSMQTGVSVAVQADIEGSGGTAAAAAIDDFVTTFLGLSVTNDAALVGTDAELDPALRARAESATGALSPNGPADAYRYFATSAVRAATGEAIGVTRIKVTPDGDGGIAVVVATGSGGVTGSAGDPATDLGAVHVAMEENAVPLGVTLTTTTATALAVPVTATAWVLESLADTDAALETAVGAALTALLAAMPIGGVVISPAAGKVYKQALEGCVSGVFGTSLVNLSMSLPAGDTTPTSTEAPVSGTLTLTIVRVPV